ncbi:Dabb family protein [Spirosoma koreense]
MERRNFLATGLLAGLTAPITSFAQVQAPSPTSIGPGPLLLEAAFVHHGLYWLKDKDDKATYACMRQSFKELKKIKEVKFLHVGAPSSSDTDATYTFSYLALFASKQDKHNYLKHPFHSQFFTDFKDVVSKVKLYDS